MSAKLPLSFYEHDDVTYVAQSLLGKVLCTHIDGIYTSGIIVETEAYRGTDDKACHSCSFGYTERTKIMFGRPGVAYVFLCYGIHHLFNVVTNKEDRADAVLIRAIEPCDGIEHILKRRNHSTLKRATGGGPGIVSSALGITTKKHYGADLLESTIWIEERGSQISDDKIISSPRIGVDYAGEDALLPWRYRIRNNKFTSPQE